MQRREASASLSRVPEADRGETTKPRKRTRATKYIGMRQVWQDSAGDYAADLTVEGVGLPCLVGISPCPLYLQERTSSASAWMSAMCQKQTCSPKYLIRSSTADAPLISSAKKMIRLLDRGIAKIMGKGKAVLNTLYQLVEKTLVRQENGALGFHPRNRRLNIVRG